MLREFCPLDQVARELLERAMVRLDLSARAYDRIVKVARTIADLADSNVIELSISPRLCSTVHSTGPQVLDSLWKSLWMMCINLQLL